MANIARQIITKYESLGVNSAISDVKKYSAATKNLGTTSDKTGKSITTLGSSMTGLVARYATVTAGVFALTRAFRGLSEAAQTSQSLSGLDALAGRTGQSGPQLLGTVNDVTKGLVTLGDQVRSVNLSLSSGFSAEQIEGLAEVALRASKAIGVGLPEAYTRVTRASSKLETELLDELGIYTKVGPATRAYAAELGKAVGELTEFERRQAFVNGVITEGLTKYKDINIATNTTADTFGALSAKLSDLGTNVNIAIGDTLAPVIRSLTSDTTSLSASVAVAGGLFGRVMIPALVQVAEVGFAANKTVSTLIRTVGTKLTAAAIVGGLTVGFIKLLGYGDELTDVFRSLGEAAKGLGGFLDARRATGDSFRDLVTGSLDELEDRVGNSFRLLDEYEFDKKILGIEFEVTRSRDDLIKEVEGIVNRIQASVDAGQATGQQDFGVAGFSAFENITSAERFRARRFLGEEALSSLDPVGQEGLIVETANLQAAQRGQDSQGREFYQGQLNLLRQFAANLPILAEARDAADEMGVSIASIAKNFEISEDEAKGVVTLLKEGTELTFLDKDSPLLNGTAGRTSKDFADGILDTNSALDDSNASLGKATLLMSTLGEGISSNSIGIEEFDKKIAEGNTLLTQAENDRLTARADLNRIEEDGLGINVKNEEVAKRLTDTTKERLAIAERETQELREQLKAYEDQRKNVLRRSNLQEFADNIIKRNQNPFAATVSALESIGASRVQIFGVLAKHAATEEEIATFNQLQNIELGKQLNTLLDIVFNEDDRLKKLTKGAEVIKQFNAELDRELAKSRTIELQISADTDSLNNDIRKYQNENAVRLAQLGVSEAEARATSGFGSNAGVLAAQENLYRLQLQGFEIQRETLRTNFENEKALAADKLENDLAAVRAQTAERVDTLRTQRDLALLDVANRRRSVTAIETANHNNLTGLAGVLDTFVNKFKIIVEELARATGKTVNLDGVGGDTVVEDLRGQAGRILDQSSVTIFSTYAETISKAEELGVKIQENITAQAEGAEEERATRYKFNLQKINDEEIFFRKSRSLTESTNNELNTLITDLREGFSSGLSTALGEVINGTNSLREAGKNLLDTLARRIQSRALDNISNSITGSLFGGLGSLFGGASTATSLGSVTASPGPVQFFNRGGPVQDTVPAMLEPGEFVFSKFASKGIGYNNLERMNSTGKVAPSAPPVVNVEVINQTSRDVDAEVSVDPRTFAIQAILTDIKNNGPTKQAIRSIR